MKIGVCSDLHLEFGDLMLTNEDNVDVLILSGDILVERDLDMYDRRQEELGFSRYRSQRFHDFFSRVNFQFPKVIYVAGNHEHYHGDFKYTINELKRKLAQYENVHVLDKECIEIQDVMFIGGTLWTDMNKSDEYTLHGIRSMMNDFRCVKNSLREVNYKVKEGDSIRFSSRPSIFCPEDAVEDHNKMLQYIKVMHSHVAEDKKIVVVGHHAPSKKSTHPRYAHEGLMNGGYSSDLDDFITNHPKIKLWTHGHTHEEFDYVVGETRIVCNPRGYIGHEERADNFKLKVVEV